MAIPKHHPRLLLTCALAGLVLAGCGSLPQTGKGPAAVVAPPEPAVDAAALAILGQAPAGRKAVVEGGLAVTPGPLYTSATGHTCRAVLLQPRDLAAYRRLACASGGDWQWVSTATPEFID